MLFSIWPKKCLNFLVIGRFKIGAVTVYCGGGGGGGGGGNLFIIANQWNMWYTHTWLLEPDRISHTQSIVAKRRLTNRANVHTPSWKSHLKHSMEEFQSTQQFWLQFWLQPFLKSSPFCHVWNPTSMQPNWNRPFIKLVYGGPLPV